MTATIPAEPGTALEPITRGPISRSQIARFAAATGDFNPIHTDEAFARKIGFPSIIAHGPLTIHGVTKDVALPFTIAGTVKDQMGRTRVVAQSSITINRKDYGLVWNKPLEGGGMLVGDDVKIDLNVEAVK